MSNIFSVTIEKTQDLPIILGNTSTFLIRIQNLSTTVRLYNLNIILTTPDGLTITSASQGITSTVTNSSGVSTYSWINLKDLAPLEIDYTFSVTVRSNTKFKDNSTVPFGYIFNEFNVLCQVDTQPRGNYDVGNTVLQEQISMTYKTVRYFSTIVTAGKVLKGAGTSITSTDYTKTATATCNIKNNSVSISTVNIRILLPDGIRYIGNLATSGTDSSKLTTPNISSVLINGKSYTQLYFSAMDLSINSNTNLTFTYAIWNRYLQNTGTLINHRTPFSLIINTSSIDDNLESTANFIAMDVIITNSINKTYTDVGETLTFTGVYSVGGYYDLSNIIVNYLIPDGITYSSSSSTPSSVVDDPTRKGYYLTYNFSLASKNSSRSITITGVVNSTYRYRLDSEGHALNVVAFDSFKSEDNISAALIPLLNTVTDNATASSNINFGKITKTFLGGFYSNGLSKPISTLAPGDLAEYRLTYDASTLNVVQKGIKFFDFFPLSADPIDNLTYTYTGYKPPNLTALPINPHGSLFNYGDIPSRQLITINFKVPIKTLGGSGQNNNLFKFQGVNNDGYSYSGRSQVTVNIGSPNISLTKTVTGPNTSAIKASETYVYTVTVRNSSTLGTETDAFNFILSDNLSSWFTVIPSTISISGAGSYEGYSLSGNNIQVSILKLSPGQSLTLTYSVVISNVLAPGLTIITTAATTNPYSQPNDRTSYQYTNQNRTASTTILSEAIALNKTTTSNLLKIGSDIIYSINLIIPKGTISYNVSVKDTLPSGVQTYIGSATRNGIPITPSIVGNTITFPNEGTINALITEQNITYSFTAKIISGTKSLNVTKITQTNNYQCIYRQTPSGSNITINRNLTIQINVPNIVLSLSATDTTVAKTYTSTGTITTNSILLYKLDFTNNSLIKLVNGLIEIPINPNLSFISINSLQFCTASFNASSKKLFINIPSLNSLAQGLITFTLKPLPTSTSGTSVLTQATAIQYYNDIFNKIYSGEKSNLITLSFAPGVSLLPSSTDRINDDTSFRVSPPGSTVTIINYFKNTGGGYDDFNLKIAKVGLPYTLYIDDIKIADIPANTDYSADLTIMKNIPPNGTRTIKIESTLPLILPLGQRYDFIVTVTSKTSPYPSKTVTNIDPRF